MLNLKKQYNRNIDARSYFVGSYKNNIFVDLALLASEELEIIIAIIRVHCFHALGRISE